MPKIATLEQARAAKAGAAGSLAGIGDVVGVGLTKAKRGYAVKVNLRRRPTGPVPATLDGVPLVVDVVGDVRKRPAASPRSGNPKAEQHR
jgi:hypothetical protein